MNNNNFSFGGNRKTQMKKPIPLTSDSARYVLMSTPTNGQEEVLKMLVKSHILTLDFVREYYNMLDKETVSKSPYLPYEIKDVYPELFDIDIWNESQEKSFSFVLKDDSIKDYPYIVLGILEQPGMSKEIGEYSIELLDRFHDTTENKLRDFIIRNVKNINTETIQKYFSIFPVSALDNYYIQKEIYGNTDVLEKLLKGNSKVDVRLLLKVLNLTTDQGWIRRIISEVMDDTIYIPEKVLTVDEELANLIETLPDDLIPSVLRLTEKSGATISYTVLQNILVYKDLEEDDLIAILDLYLKNGGRTALIKYAKDHNYEGLLSAIVFASI